jgi:hypothetical protein
MGQLDLFIRVWLGMMLLLCIAAFLVAFLLGFWAFTFWLWPL